MRMTTTLEQLTPLMDFPGYYIDLSNGDVFSNRQIGGWCKSTILRKLSGKLMGRNNRNCQRVYTLKDKDNNLRYASQARLMIAAKRGISYYIIPKDISCNYKEGEITMKNRSEAAVEGWKDRLLEMNKNRIYHIRHNISCLKLLEKAYLGERNPLFEYIGKQTHYYVTIIRNKTKWGCERAYEAVQMATVYLYDVITGKHASNINYLDNWFVKTAIHLYRNEFGAPMSTTVFKNEEAQYRASDNKEIYSNI